MNDPLGLFGDEQNNDPLGLFEDEPKKKAGLGVSIKQALSTAGTAMDQAISLPAGALASVFSQEEGDKIFRGMDAREETRKKWANPEQLETTLGNDVVGMALTLPAQIPAMAGQAAMKGIDLIRRGESVGKAQAATAADALLNAVGMGPMQAAKTFAGRAAIGAAGNVAFGAGSDAITQLLAEQEETKKAYDPYDPRRRAQEALVGGVMQGAFGERPKAPTGKKIDGIRADAKPTPKPLVERPKPRSPEWYRAQEQLGADMLQREARQVDTQNPLFEQFDERSPVSKYQTEMAPDMWRVDENGMPIRADLSMEIENLQQPLQRNLFGDELDVNFPRDPNEPLANAPMEGVSKKMVDDAQLALKRSLEKYDLENNSRPLTEAIDAIPEGIRNRVDGKFAPGTTRQAALDRLRGELPADASLEVARMDAERADFSKWVYEQALDAGGDKPKGFNAKMKKQKGALLFGKDPLKIEQTEDGFVAKVGDKEVGYLRSNITPEQRAMLGEDASVDMVKVLDDFKGKGVGSALYEAWAKANEGNVIPSGKTSTDAWKAWKRTLPGGVDKFVNQEAQRILGGADPQMVLGNIPDPEVAQRVQARAALLKKQGGGVKIDWSKEADQMENIKGSYIPTDPSIETSLAQARTEKDSKLWTYTQSGGTSAAMKSGSTLIKAVSQTVQNALKRAELQIRNTVFPVEKALRTLSKQELNTLADVFKEEMFQDYRFNGDVLAKHLSVKQLEAYVKMRDMFDVTLSAQNAARVAKGQKPITAKEAYMSSRWQGDFRQPVYEKVFNADGTPKLDKETGKQKLRLVYYLASNTKKGLDGQVAGLKEKLPDFVYDQPGHVVKSVRGGADIQSLYSTMLDILGRDDPAVKRVQEAMEASIGKDVESLLAQEKHFERKSGVRGFVGDRPDTKLSYKGVSHTFKRNPSVEAVKMFEQQIQYAKNAFKWSEMQKSSDNLKALLADEDLQRNQPNNMKFAKEYVKNALGQGEGKLAKAFDDTARDMGISPQVLSNAVGGLKSFFITQKLALSAGYTLSNMVQAGNVIPYLMNLRSQGFKGNPATAMAVGTYSGLAMGLAHYLRSIGGDYPITLPEGFIKEAFKYAEENGVTARSVYDEAPIDTGFSLKAKLEKGASLTMAIPETFVRSVAFMTYSQMLKDSGKFSDMKALFQKAEELVNMSMVDYRETERPLMFSKAGTAGNFLNTLQTYPMSFYNQWLYMGNEAAKGRPAGLFTLTAFQFGIAGMMGVPGFEDMEKLYKWMRDNWLSDSTWNKAMKNEFFADPKLWLMKNGDKFGQAINSSLEENFGGTPIDFSHIGESAIYGALSTETGTGLTSRVAAPGAGAMLQSPLGPITDIAKQVGSVASAVGSVDDKVKWGQAAMNVVPTGLQGFLETQPFMEGITFVTNPDGSKTFMKNSDLSDKKGGYRRSENEVDIRKWGLRSQDEVVTRDVSWSASSANQTLTKKSSELIDRIYTAARSGDTERTGKLLDLYTELTGDTIGRTQLENQIKEEMLTDLEREALKAGTNPRKLMNVGRSAKYLEDRK